MRVHPRSYSGILAACASRSRLRHAARRGRPPCRGRHAHAVRPTDQDPLGVAGASPHWPAWPSSSGRRAHRGEPAPRQAAARRAGRRTSARDVCHTTPSTTRPCAPCWNGCCSAGRQPPRPGHGPGTPARTPKGSTRPGGVSPRGSEPRRQGPGEVAAPVTRPGRTQASVSADVRSASSSQR
ncbi:hypothetical protein HBB16_11105 [Pseudonocardia sp. MCCB 268]|nr:hypothetical protein [Pseudonocardia cytotoxica]